MLYTAYLVNYYRETPSIIAYNTPKPKALMKKDFYSRAKGPYLNKRNVAY